MEKVDYVAKKMFCGWTSVIRKTIFQVLRVGPIPSHIAVIMDGNRRYGRKKRLAEGGGHDAGALSLLFLLVYCYELGVKHLTAYAFGIDNFRRKPQEVNKIMSLMRECIPLLGRIAKHRPVKVHFAGNLQLLSADIREGAKTLMAATVHNTRFIFILCVSYTCTNEIMHIVEESCKKKYDQMMASDGGQLDLDMKVASMERHMYMAVAPDPDVLIRTGGVHRLSNFLQWHTSCGQLSALTALFPELSIWHLVWVVLDFQRNIIYYKKKRDAALELGYESCSSSSPYSQFS